MAAGTGYALAMITPFQTALATFPWCSVTLTCPLPAEFADMPDLPDRLRGAIGNRLRERPPGGDAALLHGLMHAGSDGKTEMVRPVVLQTDRHNNTLVVRLHLAGTAANLMVTASHALRAALTGGIRMGTEIRYRVALDPGPADFARHLGFTDNSPAGADRLYLRLSTPLSLRIGRNRAAARTPDASTATSISTLPWNIESRFRRLAAAFHRPVTVPSGIPRRLTDLLVLADDRTYPHIYLHYSKSHRDPIPVSGIGGELILSGRCQPYLSLLAFARVFHAGSSTAFGLGRIEYAAT